MNPFSSKLSSLASPRRRSSNVFEELSASLNRGEIVRRIAVDGTSDLSCTTQEVPKELQIKKGKDIP